ncbi:DUF6196 family protein [Streptosporangium sp. NPDC000396]|uniref:DUF6196 family protein n=1 Tax=Streptosporangium sp. NPDC000396 TaxID=3366185 RepID=UPI00368359BF
MSLPDAAVTRLRRFGEIRPDKVRSGRARSDTARGGVFDYWSCPAELLSQATKVVDELRSSV